MKKSFCILVLMLMAFSGIYTASAQSKAIQVNSSSVELYKQLNFKGTPTISVPAYGITIDLPKCDVYIKNDISENSGSIPWPLVSISPNPNLYNYGYIAPEIDNFMDLGDATHFFRKSYIKQNVSKANQATLSDGRYKENIKDLKDAADKIMALRAVSFDLKKTEGDSDTAELKNKVGFIAQEMQNVLPYSVGYIPEIDMYTVDYTSVIPYLVQAFQSERSEKEEMRLQMTELQNQVSSLQELVQSLLAQNGTTPPAPGSAPKHGPKNTVKAARLFQNLPNPFSQSTIIRYELPKTAGNASIQVFDMGGRMVESIQLSHTQEIGQVELSAGKLLPGTYTYSLIVSGKVIDSKCMVVTE